MVFSGLFVIFPLANDIAPILPETAEFAKAGDPLPPGEGTAGQDGKAGDGADVLIINTYMYYAANPTGYQGSWDSYYIAMKQSVDDVHSAGFTVDAWYMSYYVDGYGPGRRDLGYYDKANYYHNYYPVDSNNYPDCIDSYDDYKAVIIIGYGNYCFGYNYNGYYETTQPVTAERAMTGLEDYAANEGNIMWACYYSGYAPFYYQKYMGGPQVQANMRPRLRTLFDVTTGTMNRNRAATGSGYYPGYGQRGMEGETPNTSEQSIGICHQDWPDYGYEKGDKIAYWYHSQVNTPASYPSIDRYPDQDPTYNTYLDHTYVYCFQNPINDGIICMEGSGVSYTQISMTNGWCTPPNPGAVQSDHGGEFKTVCFFDNPWMGYSIYRTTSGTYKYRTRVGPWATGPLMGSILNFLVDSGPPDIAEMTVTEIQNTGNEDEWLELATKATKPVNLYEIYVSPEGGTGTAPTTFFPEGVDNLGAYGTPADPKSHTYYLNAENLYIDNYYTDMYLYKEGYDKVWTTNFAGNSHWRVWWDKSEDAYLTMAERNGRIYSELQDVYQFYLPDILFEDQLWARLDGDFETDCTIYNYNPGNSKLLNWEKDADLDAYVGGFQFATLDEFYRTTSTVLAGKMLYFTTDPDVSSYLWTVQFPELIFVNDNQYSTEHIYYSHVTGHEVGSGGTNILDIYFPDHLDHYTNPEYFTYESLEYGGFIVDYTDPGIQSQITVVDVEGPILNQELYIDKNTGLFRASGTGANTVTISIWVDIGTDYNVEDNTYTVTWIPDTQHLYLRAVAYDYVDNFAVSEIFSDFQVDGIGPEAPSSLEATLNLIFDPIAEIQGLAFDTQNIGFVSGVDYVLLYVNGKLVVDEFGEAVMVEVINNTFRYDLVLDDIDSITGNVSYQITAQAFDNVSNSGDVSSPAVWTNTGDSEPLRVISPANVKDVPMKEEWQNPDDSLDEIRSITVTFLETEQDFQNYQFVIRPGQLRTSSDAVSLGIPRGTKFLYNYYTVELPASFTNFEAQVAVEFHLSRNSPLGFSTQTILDNIRLISRTTGEPWSVLEITGGRPQEIVGDGMYQVQTLVNRFSDFAVIVAQTDLTVKDIIVGATPALPGQNITVKVTVHNGGDFPKDAENVQVVLTAIDEEGNAELIGVLDFGTIDPNVDLYPDDPLLGKGDKQNYLHWEAKNVTVDKGDFKNWTIKAEVDLGGYVRESNEHNNQKTEQIEFVGASETSTSFGLTYLMMALGVMFVVGLSVYIRRKRE